jgi:hypothetical protein
MTAFQVVDGHTMREACMQLLSQLFDTGNFILKMDVEKSSCRLKCSVGY